MANPTILPNDSDSWNVNIPEMGSTATGLRLNTSGKYLAKDIEIPRAVASVTMTKGNGALSQQNVTFSDSNTSGVSVTGSGSVSATAKVTAEGYVPQTNSLASGASTASNELTKYITKVQVPNGKTFQLQDSIYTWTWTIDSSGNVTIT